MMEDHLSPSSVRQLNRFCYQYLQLFSKPEFPDNENLRDATFQQALFAQVFAEDSVENHPPKRYRFRILKDLTQRIENGVQDWDEEGISDDIMDSLSSLLSSSIPYQMTAAQEKCFVRYTLSSLKSLEPKNVPSITLLEARSLLAASGTTGISTWDASLHLGKYLCSVSETAVRGKSVLELGAGTGYISILCAKYLGAVRVISTDGSDDVIRDLPANFQLNGLQRDSTTITTKKLVWGMPFIDNEYGSWNNGRHLDAIIGADVTYDVSAIPALVQTLKEISHIYPSAEIIIAATIRNQVTFDFFLQTCYNNGYIVKDIDFDIRPDDEQQEAPFYNYILPMRICSLLRAPIVE